MLFALENPQWFRCFPAVLYMAICPAGASHTAQLTLAAIIYKAEYG